MSFLVHPFRYRASLLAAGAPPRLSAALTAAGAPPLPPLPGPLLASLGGVGVGSAAPSPLGLTAVLPLPPGALLHPSDVLFTGREVVVALTPRTNRGGLAALCSAFPGLPVNGVALPPGLPPSTSGASLLAALGSGVLAVAGGEGGALFSHAVREVSAFRKSAPLQFVWVPGWGEGGGGLLRVNSTLLLPAGDPGLPAVAEWAAAHRPDLQVVEVEADGCNLQSSVVLLH